MQAALGEAHLRVGTSYNNLAGCLEAQGRAVDAEPLFRKGLEIWQAALGEAHPNVGASYINLAACLQAQGRDVDGEPLFRKGLEILKAHPIT